MEMHNMFFWCSKIDFFPPVGNLSLITLVLIFFFYCK